MENINVSAFMDETFKVIDEIVDKELNNIDEAAKICADAIAKGGVIQVFGSGHSVGFGMELFGRAGSLVPVHTIITADFVVKGMYSLEEFKDMDNIFERRPNIADKFYDLYEINEEDVFIIISNSGINGLVIDLANTAKSKNHKVIVVTSLKHTNAEDSRHPSGKKLKDFGDVVIDNCGPRGDAILDLDEGGKIGSVSAISGIMIAQSLAVSIVDKLEKANVEVPILKFEDSIEAKEFNEKLLEKYKGRI